MSATKIIDTRAVLLSLTVFFGGAALANAAESTEPEARPGVGRELFVARCTICHSLDYVEMHAKFANRGLWETSINKMRNAFKAPITDEEARQILDYVERAYAAQDPTKKISAQHAK